MVTNKMSMQARNEYLKQLKPRYLKASKQEKRDMLDEFCRNSGYNRKYAIRRLSAKNPISAPKTINRKRGCYYTNEDIYWLARVWEIMDYPCGQRLAPVLAEIVDVLVCHKELAVPEAIAEKIKGMSPDTINKRLRPRKAKLKRKLNSTTKPGSLVKSQIPIRVVSWDEARVGCCELDLVAHCGDNAGGEFINSLNLTDILTQWTESIAFLGKAQARIMAGLDDIRGRLPFALLAIDPDNGSEFINWQLYRYCVERALEFTRGRPYQKNDNAHIEQKNWTHTRKIFGYSRLDTEAELAVVNDLYRNEVRLYKNFFMPNVKLIDKQRYGKNWEKIKKIYDKAKTPYQRVLECDQVDEQAKEQLRQQYKQLNPAALRRSILEKTDRLKKLKNNNAKVVIPAPHRVTFTNHST